MNIRASLSSAATCVVFACALAVVPLTAAVAGGSTSAKTTGDNTYEGRQSGNVSGNGDSSGSTVINSDPRSKSEAAISDSAIDNKIAQAIGAPAFHTVIRVQRSESAATIQTTQDEPRVIRRTHFQQWRVGWSLPSAPGVVASGPVVYLGRVRNMSTAEIHRIREPDAAEIHTTVGRQAGGLTGPPGPVGPVSPATSGPGGLAPVAPSITAPPAAPPATPPVQTAPARPKLPLNGVESARMAKTALVLMLIGFGLMAFARRFKPRMRVVEPV